MEGNVLHILPSHGVDQSILLAVLLGLWLLFLLTETFGWVFSGLVVPGYLGSVFAFSAPAGIAVIVEALITLVLAKGIATLFSKTDAGTEFFGRERFFLIVLVSVIVRQNSELWMLPATAKALDAAFGSSFHIDSQLSSIGLVLVPLATNMLWKLGPRQSAVQLGVLTGVIYCVLVFVLLPYTNLSYASLELTYEDTALDFLGSPKAYIVLLVTAFVASRSNLLYGWDFAGILVPALLALVWITPFRILTTAVEALLLAGAVQWITKLPGVRTLNLEGARKVVLVFTLSFTTKIALGAAIGGRFADLPVTDLFGFGYLLPSLLATKMVQKKIVWGVLLPALNVSFVGFVVASAIGLMLDWAAPRPSEAEATRPAIAVTPRGSVAFAALAADVRARRGPHREAPLEPLATDRAVYARAWSEIARAARGVRSIDRTRLAAAGYELVPIDGAEWLREREERLAEQVGLDSAILHRGRPGPVLEVPRPASEPAAAQIAPALCERVACRAIVFAGVDTRGAGDPLRRSETRFAAAHAAFAGTTVLQIRADAPDERPVLHVQGELPAGLALRELWPAGVRLEFGPPERPPLAWGDPRFAILRVHRRAVRDLHATPRAANSIAIDDLLAQRFLTAHVVAPLSETELRMLTARVVPGALEALRDPRAIPWAQWLAAQIGLELHEVELGDGTGLALLEAAGDPRGWGGLVLRRSARVPIAIEVPRPTTEAGALRLAMRLFHESRAHAIVIGGFEPSTSDALAAAERRIAGSRSPLHAFHLALHRSLEVRPDALFVQIRGLAGWRSVDTDVVVGLGPPVLDPAAVPARLRELLRTSPSLATLRTRMVRGEADIAALGGWDNPQLRASRELGPLPVAITWISEAARRPYLAASRTRAQEWLARTGLARTEEHPIALLTNDIDAVHEFTPTHALDSWMVTAEAAADLTNVHMLRGLAAADAEDDSVRVLAGFSVALGRVFVFIEVAEGTQRSRALIVGDGDRSGPIAIGAHERGAILDALWAGRTVVVHGRAR